MRIANADLSALWPPELVWQVISDVAVGLIRLALGVAWGDFARQRGIEGDCPVSIVAFGKLGGRELNYSSDVDLAYVHGDGIDEALERELVRFCEHFGNAVGSRMGRGSLYRIDLRLRPYGNAGPIIRSMRSYEAYYTMYAEPWEHMALIRSAAIAGPRDLAERWDSMRVERAFRLTRAESAFDDLLENWRRTRASADPSDLKRYEGGIRDIEFLIQVDQWLQGHSNTAARVRSTLEARLALGLPEALSDSYRFFRQLEHRIQLASDLQTHTYPEDNAARDRLANLMCLPDGEALTRELATHRRTITNLVREILPQLDRPAATGARDAVKERLGGSGNALLGWFESMPEPDAFYGALAENAHSLERVRAILERAPAIVDALRDDLVMTERVLSGEIEEDREPWNRVEQLSLGAPPKQFAEAYRRAWLTLAVQYALEPSEELGLRMTELFDAALVHVARRLQADFTVIALGSYGAREMSFHSDGDLLLLVSSSGRQSDAESQAQAMLAIVESARRYGAVLEVDLRLRPDGGKGLLVRTFEGFGTYELEQMEMWERFALGSARLVHGDPEALRLVRKAAHAQPLTPERLKELVAMKKRIENERVSAPFQWREVKLGHGSLSDLEWLVHLHEMRYPTATDAHTVRTMPERIRQLGRARLLTAVEVEELLEAREHLHHLRAVLYLLGYANEMLPENPAKLDRIAAQFGRKDANDFLSLHEPLVARLHAIFADSRERLRA